MGDAGKVFRRLAQALEGDTWLQTARPAQLPPHGDWTVWVMKAGRGWEKTLAGAQFVRAQVENGAARNIAIIGATAADVRDVCIEGPSGVLAISSSWNRPTYEPSKRRLTWPNGAQATMFSSEEPDRLRGPNHDLAWCDELASWNNAEATWNMLALTLRLGKCPRCCVTTTPKPTKLVRSLLARVGQDVVMTGGGTFENAANLAPGFLDSIKRKYAGTRLGRQELEAELLEDIEGALWNRDRIDELRRSNAPELERIVVAIDPAISVGEDSDETGIVVCGLGVDGHGYVLEDASGKYLPTEWANKAVNLYRKYEADRIVAEINQGGQMVEATIRAVDKNVAYRGVHAKRGKMLRAEPVSALYEQFRVHHVGSFPELEDQQCCFAGGGDSPDRLDAVVYAISDLMVEPEIARPVAMTGRYYFAGYAPKGVELRAQQEPPKWWIDSGKRELTN